LRSWVSILIGAASFGSSNFSTAGAGVLVRDLDAVRFVVGVYRGYGLLGLISIDLRINSSRSSLLLSTFSIGGNKCNDGGAAMARF
jgi:hypothetical protein